MKFLFAWTCVLLVGIVVQTSHQQCLDAFDQMSPNRNTVERLYSGEQNFSLNLLKTINQLNPHDNIFFSPYSTYHALLLVYFISANHTEANVKRTLGLDSSSIKSDIASAYKLDRYNTKYDTGRELNKFTSANRLYVTDRVEVRDCYFWLFGEELIRADFTTSADYLRNNINRWVEEQTHNMIKNLLPPGSIDASTTLALVNAAYFKGVWENKFNPDETKPEVFYVSPTKQIVVDMMHLEATLNYDVSETLKAHILELPYESKLFSMYILLPPTAVSDGVGTILKNLNLENFQNIVNGSLYSRQVEVSLPKFSLEQSLELVPILERLGVGNLFQQDADFSGLSGSRDLTLGRGLHKAKIELDEEGTKASASTVLFTWRMSIDDSEKSVPFRCDRPFVYLIYDKKMHTVLFMGVLKNPQ